MHKVEDRAEVRETRLNAVLERFAAITPSDFVRDVATLTGGNVFHQTV